MPRLDQLARQVITPWQTSIRPTWTIGQIRTALLAHRQGQFAGAAQLFDSLLEDDEIPGDLAKRVNATLRSEFQLRIDEDRDLTDQEQQVADLFPEMAPDDQLFDLLASWLMLGVGVATIDWDTSGPIWVPKLRTLPAEFLRYDEHLRVWEYEAREGTQKVEPGNGKWVLLTSGERGWIWGLIRGLAVLWLGKRMTEGDWQRYCQKHGLPIIKAKVPIFRDEKEKNAFIDALGEIQSEGVIGLPQGTDESQSYDVELLEATDQSWESFQANLDRADRKIQIMLLGSNIGTEQSAATGGSRAAAETSAMAVDREKAKADEKRLSQALKDQLLRPFFALNFGPSADVPCPYWDVAPEADAREWADAQVAFVGMLNQLRTSGFRLKNAEDLALEYGLELEEDPDAPPAAGTEAAAKIAAAAKPPTAGPAGRPKPKAKGRAK
jgi:phage gp29-like protein